MLVRKPTISIVSQIVNLAYPRSKNLSNSPMMYKEGKSFQNLEFNPVCFDIFCIVNEFGNFVSG